MGCFFALIYFFWTKFYYARVISKKFKIDLVGKEDISKKEEAEIFSKVLNIFINKRESRNQARQKLLKIKHFYNEKI